MYNAFTGHTRKESEPARIEAEYARKQNNISRSTKEAGKMATLVTNRNIGDPAKAVEEEGSTRSGFMESLSENVAARIAQAQKKFTKATKGRAFGDA
jgi:hypothetical protein